MSITRLLSGTNEEYEIIFWRVAVRFKTSVILKTTDLTSTLLYSYMISRLRILVVQVTSRTGWKRRVGFDDRSLADGIG